MSPSAVDTLQNLLFELLKFISEPPGSLFYHLVVLYAVGFAAAIATGHFVSERNAVSLRLALAAGGVLIGYLITAGVALLAASERINALIIIPPLARMAGAFSLALIIWIAAAPTPSRLADVLMVGVLGLIILAAALSGFVWVADVNAGSGQYNGSIQDNAWSLSLILLAGMGVIMLLARRKEDWGVGAILLSLLLAGYALHLFVWLKDVTVPSMVRWMELIALPIFWTALVYRRAHSAPHVVLETVAPISSSPGAPRMRELLAEKPTSPPPTPPTEPPQRAVIDPKAAVALASLNSAARPEEISQLITLAVAHTCRPEVCLVISPPDELGMCSVRTAYDLAREQFIPGSFFSANEMPEFRAALKRKDISQLRPERNIAEVRRLAGAAGFAQAGPVLIAPLAPQDQLASVLVLIAPYGRREWSAEAQNLLTALLDPLTEALSSDHELERLGQELDEATAQARLADEAERAARSEADQLELALENARVEAERLTADILQLRAEMDSQQRGESVEHLRTTLLAEQTVSLTEREAQWRAINAETEQALAASQQQAAQLQSQVEQLHGELTSAADWRLKYDALTGEVTSRQQRAVELQTDLDRARAQLDAQANEVGVYQQREAALQAELDRLRQDLRQAAREAPATVEPPASDASAPSLREAELEADLNRARVELNKLSAQTAELEQLRAASQAASEWQMKYMALAIETGAHQQRKVDLQTELERAQADLRALSQPSSELEQLRAELQTALEWRDRYDAAVDEGMAHQNRATELREELERLRQSMETARADLQATTRYTAEIARLQTELHGKAQEIERLTAEQERLRTAPSSERTRTDELRTRLEGELQTLRLQLEMHQRQAAAWRIDYEAMLEQERQLRTELDLTRAELRRLGEAPQPPAPLPVEAVDPHVITHLTAELENARAELAAQTTALSEAREEVTARERQFIKLQSVMASLNDQARRLTEVQAELVDTRARLEATQASLGERNTQVFETQHQLAEKERELTDAMAALAELSTQTQTLTLTQKQLLEAQSALSAAQAGLADSGAPLTDSAVRPFLPQASVEVIASLSQELRQPMSAIVGYSDLLLGESVGIIGALQRKFLERVKASCERMESLLHDLIRVTDIDSGALTLVPESLDVMYIVEDAILSCGAQFREKGINLRLDLAEQLPTVSADRDALRQVLTHLLNNAGNASDANGEVVLSVREDAGQSMNGAGERSLFISVRDSGGGIALADQSRVFSRFYRADAPLIAGLGDTGVGLSVAKALVEAHGGRLWFTTEPGQGSTFNVLLPIHNAGGANGALSP